MTQVEANHAIIQLLRENPKLSANLQCTTLDSEDLDMLENYLMEYPEIRFEQALWNHNLQKMGNNLYNETSVNTYNRLMGYPYQMPAPKHETVFIVKHEAFHPHTHEHNVIGVFRREIDARICIETDSRDFHLGIDRGDFEEEWKNLIEDESISKNWNLAIINSKRYYERWKIEEFNLL